MAKTPVKAKARRQGSRKSSLPTLDPPPALLEGEDEAAYLKLLAQVTAAVEPKHVIEEFWVRDVVDLAWDAIRLRRLKADLLNASLANGLEKVLSSVSSESHALAESWYGRDKDAIKKVDRLLGQAGQSMDAVMAQTFSVKLDDIERIDRMLANVEARRHLVLREIDRHRAAVAARLRSVTEQIEDASFVELPKPNGPDAEVT
jgi:hypothetical protein